MADSNVVRYLKDPDAPFYSPIPNGPSQPVKIPATRNETPKSIASSPDSFRGSSSYTPSSPSILSRTLSRSSTASTAPSQGNDLPWTLDQQLSNMARSMPCLFQDIIGCGRCFRMDDFESWCRHNTTHFGDRGPPTYSRCIFCNEATFESDNAVDCWRKRMRHIFDHFQQGDTLEESLPDFEVIKDLYQKGGISRGDYDRAMAWTQRPEIPGLRSLSFETEKVRAARRAEERALSEYIVKDPRHRRRRV